MTPAAHKTAVYLETGQKRAFAGALDWPGWCRSGRDPHSALQALLDYGPRYARVLKSARLGFKAPTDVSAFLVRERLKGNATTDFGAPGIPPAWDSKDVGPAELKRLEKILRASWRAFEQAAEEAAGKALRTGPRGGGRQLQGVIEHVLDANEGYLYQLGWKLKRDASAEIDAQLKQVRQGMLDAVAASARGELAARGPRGGLRWTARYFVRRAVWHILDHAWEIEDRLLQR